MRAWWESREPRERVLLGVLGALLAAFALLFALVLPVMDARANAEAELRRAQADYRIVAQTAVRPQTGGARAAFSRSVLLSAAREAGLQVTRIQADRDGGFAVWIDDAETAALYGMFEQLLTRTTAQMDRVIVSADATGRLSAQFTVR